MFTLGCVLRLGQFLIFSVDDDADPLALILCLVHLHTHFGIGTHPLHLLPKRRENVQVTVFVGKMNWNHIRLVLIGAAQPAQRSMLQNRLAFLCCHLVDFHDGFLRAEARAATHPTFPASFTPPMGAWLPGALVNLATMGSPANSVSFTESAESFCSLRFCSGDAGASMRV